MRQMSMSGYWATYGYDVRDERVAWVDSAEPGIHYTLRGLGNEILREVHELNGSWSFRKDYLYAGKEHIATIDGAGVKHVHKDHLGSTRLVTSATGSVVSQHSYWPFGEEMTVTSSPERMRFAGHERDALSSLDYMHARFYAPWGGRFLSVDPGRDDDFHKPQSFNLYAYVRNNPVNALDTTGKANDWAFGPFSPYLGESGKMTKEVIARSPKPETPEQRAIEMAIVAGPLVAGAIGVFLMAAGPEAAVAGAVGMAFNVAGNVPTLSDSQVAPDQKVALVLASASLGAVSGGFVPATSPGGSALAGAASSLGVQLISGQGVNAGAAAISAQGGFTGAVISRQLSSDLVRSRTVLTAITAGTQALFDALKVFADREKHRAAKHLVAVTEQANPATGGAQR